MFVFAHTGITLGAALLLNGALVKSRTPPKVDVSRGQPQSSAGIPLTQNCYLSVSCLASLANRIDIRLLLIGSLLPDLIDKPIGQFFFRETFSNGRIYCHTLLFLILITLGGLHLRWKHGRSWLLVLSFGTFTHLILDLMWLTPKTLFWPLFGFSFEKCELAPFWSWILEMFHGFVSNPIILAPELMGAAIIVWFILLLLLRGRLFTFIRNGQV